MSSVYNPEADVMAEIERLELEARSVRRRVEHARNPEDKRVLNRQLAENLGVDVERVAGLAPRLVRQRWPFGGHTRTLPRQRARLPGGEALVDQPDRHRPLPHRGRDALDRTRVHVTDGEDPRPARLQEEWGLAVVLAQVVALDVAAGEQETVVVRCELTIEPGGVR